RGENIARKGQTIRVYGPSPRTWGELLSVGTGDAGDRTIPTHVGRTTPEYALAPRLADHPHARGENGSCSDPSATIRGPSPRTWGEHLDHCAKAQSRRTIPTHVGRTASMGASPCCRSDHPHARGETSSLLHPRLALCGPSPRTWGEPETIHESLRLRPTNPPHVGRTP